MCIRDRLQTDESLASALKWSQVHMHIQASSLSEFARLLGDNPEEVNILTREIFIGVTNFFRDPAFFEKLKYNAIYKIVERAKEDEPIRVRCV